MKYKIERKNLVEKLFSRSKVVTIGELKNLLDTKFSKTVFRYLNEINYLSSYDHAGRFYTIPQIPPFDEYGLWHHDIASFSKFGTLKLTICSLVDVSLEGFTHRELKQQLRCRVQNTLNDLTKNKLVSRESVDGLFLYVSTNNKTALAQISKRRKKNGIEGNQGVTIELPVIIEILLELLHTSVWEAKTISSKLDARGIPVTEQQVKEILYRYNLKKNS